MSLKIGSNQISPIQINNVINNQSNKTITPTKSVQTIIPQQEIFSTNIQCTQGINGTVLIANIDASFLEYGKSYQVTAPRIRYTGNIHSNNGLFNILSIDTIWTASEDGEINFTLTGNSNTPLAGRITLSKTQIKVYFQNNGGANGGILGYYNNVDTITFSSVDPYDGLDQVTIEPIPSDYIIPEGALTITNSGTVNASQYASVSIPGMANPTWTAATMTNNAAKVVYSINLTSGFKSTSQSFSSSYTLPSVAGTTITPTTTAQTAVAQYKWTTGSVIVGAIPASIGVYKKIIERTVTIPELNSFFSSQTIVPSYAFIDATNLDGSVNGVLNFSNVTNIGSSAFSGCTKLTHISGPNVTTLGSNAFYNCYSLTTASFPNATSIGSATFYGCIVLTTVSFLKVTHIGTNAFTYCSALTTVSFPNVTSIGTYAFRSCRALSSLYLTGSSVASLNGMNAFSSTPMSLSSYLGYFGSIYVPTSLLASYKAATNWSAFSDRFVGV